MEYKIVSEEYRSDLTEIVEANISRGWKPQGGVSVKNDGFGETYVQAMIKEED